MKDRLWFAFVCLIGFCVGTFCQGQRPNSFTRLTKIASQPGGGQLQVLDDSNALIYTVGTLWQAHDGGLTWKETNLSRARSHDSVEGSEGPLEAHLESSQSLWIRLEDSSPGRYAQKVYHTDRKSTRLNSSHL